LDWIGLGSRRTIHTRGFFYYFCGLAGASIRCLLPLPLCRCFGPSFDNHNQSCRRRAQLVSGIEPDPLAPSPADPRILSTAAARRTAASCCTPNTAAKSAGRPAQCALVPPCRRSTAAAPVSGGCCCCRPVPVAGGEWLLRCFYYGCVAGSGPSVGMYRIRRCRPTAVVRLIHTPFVWFEDLRRSGRHSPRPSRHSDLRAWSRRLPREGSSGRSGGFYVELIRAVAGQVLLLFLAAVGLQRRSEQMLRITSMHQ